MSTWKNKNLTHLVFELGQSETVDYNLIEALASLIEVCTLDDTSCINGTITSDYAFKDSVEKLRAKFPNLNIIYKDRLLRLSNNLPLKTYLISVGDSNKDSNISVNELANITSIILTDDITTLTDTADSIPNILDLLVNLRKLTISKSIKDEIDISNNSNLSSLTISDTSKDLEVKADFNHTLTVTGSDAASVYVRDDNVLECIENGSDEGTIEPLSDYGLDCPTLTITELPPFPAFFRWA